MKNSRLVYSMDSEGRCPDCEKPVSKCRCKKSSGNTQRSYPDDGIVRIRRETKGRKGKTVTTVFGIPLEDRELSNLAKTLKQRCGAGGSIKEGVVVIQGDHRQTLLEELRKQGFTVKLAGG